jgi:hypothetical protein
MGETSTSRKYSLSAIGLQRIEKNNYEKDFVFLVGDKEYRCPTIIADYLSPRVSSLRSQDETLSEFRLQTEDPEGCFERVLSIGYGHEVEFRAEETTFVRAIFQELLNYDLFQLTDERVEGEFEKEELVPRLEFLSEVQETSGENIHVLASHFHQFSGTDLEQLSVSVLEAILSDPGIVLEDEDALFHVIHHLASRNESYFCLLEFVRFEFLSGGCIKDAFEFISSRLHLITIGIWDSLGPRITLPAQLKKPPGRYVPPAIDSEIISRLPSIFSVFEGKTFRLLYRGGRDGFQAGDFHRLCDGHPNTLTLVSSTNDCVFGGYTPAAWSSQNGYVADASLKSFLFTLKNPHNLSPRVFPLQNREKAIFAHESYGPTFAGNHDLCVPHQCNSNTNSYSNLGAGYANDTGLAGNTVFTGAQQFTAKEVEVFEVIG